MQDSRINALDVACPVCGVEAGKRCRQPTAGGTYFYLHIPHMSRVDVAEQANQDAPVIVDQTEAHPNNDPLEVLRRKLNADPEPEGEDIDSCVSEPEQMRDGTLGEVIDRRVQVYGNPVTGFAEIAEMWTTYLGYPVQAHQVPIMMILLKVVRSKTSPDYSDHSDDIEGYLDIFRKIIGEDMIQARSVSEYIAKKWPGEVDA